MTPASKVQVRRETVVLPTYEPLPPDKHPMFLEKRVYQGSSGRVYPLPFTDRIAEKSVLRSWDAVYLENEYLRVMMLPALGGRIHRIQDKINGYDAIYHQPVIKPALVGLAGPWASGGIEFNWPQHHRPTTFMPVDVAVDESTDGSVTVWMGEHEPMTRMKGMHGARLRPKTASLEIIARAYNRTEDVQTFLWWANAAAQVHEGYQSFLPPDVRYVADHAKRAISSYPVCTGEYYGIDYGARRDRTAADLSWYANIPVPTSYMAVGSVHDFVGGYDHRAQAGLVHVADHHISPGKKQWTWGNHEFGYAWDRNLTDPRENGEYPPYIELMGGTYTDNQPDFSFLQPGETKTWSEFWFPIRGIGPVQAATVDAAVSFSVAHGTAAVGIFVTTERRACVIQLLKGGRVCGERIETLSPDAPWKRNFPVEAAAQPHEFEVRVLDSSGRDLVAVTLPSRADSPPESAQEPPPPDGVRTSDELFIIGAHLDQYRHATRRPETYWREALRRDPGDSRCNLALGRWHTRRGEHEAADRHLRASLGRITSRNPNPADGEAYYQLGCSLRHRAFGAFVDSARLDEAYAAFAKATWNQAWQSAGFHALAEIDCLRKNWAVGLGHIVRSLRANADNLKARSLRAILLRKLDRIADAKLAIAETRALDPLDWWARWLAGQPLGCDAQTKLDLALDHVRAGLLEEALACLATSTATRADQRRASPPKAVLPDGNLGAAPLLWYYRAWICQLQGNKAGARHHLRKAAEEKPDYCFPARVEEIAILRFAIESETADRRARYYLGNLLYDRRRHAEAIELWEKSVAIDPRQSIAQRNLGIAYFNLRGDIAAAKKCFDRSLAQSGDSRIVYERDQLWKRTGANPERRLTELKRHPAAVSARDDLAVEFCGLLTQTGKPGLAARLLAGRKFQPWEGGEGLALAQHVRAQIALGRRALARRRPAQAARHFALALDAPDNLGEAHHPLANQSDIYYWLGVAFQQSGDQPAAAKHWEAAAAFRGDLKEMKVQPVSEHTYYSGLALRALGRRDEARRLFREILAYGRALACRPVQIDYFATSLPTMMLFDDDLRARQTTTALFLKAQAKLGLGQTAPGKKLLAQVLARDPNHLFAAELSQSLGQMP